HFSVEPFGPRTKPARLVVETVLGEVTLASEAEQTPVTQHRRGIIGPTRNVDRKPQCHNKTSRFRRDRLEDPEAPFESLRPKEGVLGAVARDAELGETEDLRPFPPRVMQ